MFGLIEWLIALTWKVMVTAFVVGLLITLLRNGRETIGQMIQLVAKIMTVATESLSDWLTRKHMEHVRRKQEETKES